MIVAYKLSYNLFTLPSTGLNVETEEELGDMIAS